MLGLLFLVAAIVLAGLALAFLSRQKNISPLARLYAAPVLLFLLAVAFTVYLNALAAPASLEDGQAWLGMPPQCASLDRLGRGVHYLANNIVPGAVCERLVNFGKEHEFSFTATRSGFVGEPSARVAYQRGDEGRAEALGDSFEFTLYAPDQTWLGTYDRAKKYFKTQNNTALFLLKGTTYSVRASLFERPAGVKACPQQDGQPYWGIGCYVRCAKNSDCYDKNPATTDSCVFPDSCHSFCRHSYGLTFTTEPAGAVEALRQSPEYRGCFP